MRARTGKLVGKKIVDLYGRPGVFCYFGDLPKEIFKEQETFYQIGLEEEWNNREPPRPGSIGSGGLGLRHLENKKWDDFVVIVPEFLYDKYIKVQKENEFGPVSP